jgi:hypothetical protein
MDLAYYVITNNDLWREITKHHILQYTHFPDVFLEKFCNDKYFDIIKWLFESKQVTIPTLNGFVKNTFSQDYHIFNQNGYLPNNNNIGNQLEHIVEIKSFMEYILLYKSCPQIVTYILETYPEQKLFVKQYMSSKEVLLYLQNKPEVFKLLSETFCIIPKKELKDISEIPEQIDVSKMGMPSGNEPGSGEKYARALTNPHIDIIPSPPDLMENNKIKNLLGEKPPLEIKLFNNHVEKFENEDHEIAYDLEQSKRIFYNNDHEIHFMCDTNEKDFNFKVNDWDNVKYDIPNFNRFLGYKNNPHFIN